MVQVHSDKPYKCDCCQAAFRYKGNLASHKTVHTGKINHPFKYHQGGFMDVTVHSPPADFTFQVRSPTTATSAVLSSTDQPTSRRTPAYTLGKSHTSARHAAPDLSRWESNLAHLQESFADVKPLPLSVRISIHVLFISFIHFPPGGPSSRPCANSHGREAVPLWDLWNALPPPSDAQEPHAYSYRREALSCKLPSLPPPLYPLCLLAKKRIIPSPTWSMCLSIVISPKW